MQSSHRKVTGRNKKEYVSVHLLDGRDLYINEIVFQPLENIQRRNEYLFKYNNATAKLNLQIE